MSNAQHTLALLGGTPVRQVPLPPYNTIGEEEKTAVMNVLDSGELSGFIADPGKSFWGGKYVLALEDCFREHFNIKHAVAVNSATSALHCAIAASGIGPGDEVIVTPYSLSASASVIFMTGAVPVFADIDEKTFCLDPASVEAAITPYTKAIMTVNLFGHPSPLLRLREIADRHDLILIEDNAQSPDALCHGRHAGTIGDMGIFSFNRHKTIQCGEGGILITNSENLHLKSALVRNHGEFVIEKMGVKDIVNMVGLNLRMTEMEAAVALCQFRKLPSLNAQRNEMADRLTQGLSGLDGITPPFTDPDCTHVYYFYVMKYDAKITGIPRNLFTKALNAEGVSIRSGFLQPIYFEPLYQKKICFGPNGYPFTSNPRNESLSYAKGICPVTERIEDEELMLTNMLYPPLTLQDMDSFVNACEKVLNNRDALINWSYKQMQSST